MMAAEEVLTGISKEDSSTLLKTETYNDCFGRLGSQIDEKTEFKDKFCRKISGYPIIIDFRRVLQLGQTSDENGVIAGVSNRDLLHAVVGLYDVCLPDMDTETIYNTVCEKWSRTVVIAQDLKDAVDEYTEQRVKSSFKPKREKQDVNDECQEGAACSRVDVEEDVYKDEEIIHSAFKEVFSDTEDEEGEEEEEGGEGEDEDFSKGINTFIQKSNDRRRDRDMQQGIVPSNLIGIENRILACATFEKKFIKHKERVIHLTLISVRPRFRKYRIGRYLLSKCVNPSVVGNYDAIVVHADNSAVEFFGRFGFSDDIILNSKWRDLAESFTNCTLMTYLPAFAGHELLQHTLTKEKEPEMYEIDQELKIWQENSRETHQNQLCCMLKLRNEILQLKRITKSQNTLLSKLLTDNDTLRKDKLVLEKKVISYQMGQETDNGRNGEDEIDTDELIRDLEDQVSNLCSHLPPPKSTPLAPQQSQEVKVSIPSSGTNAEMIARFLQGMEMDRSISVQYTVTSILRRPESSTITAEFEKKLPTLTEPKMISNLYYCGSLERPSRLPQILSNGFTNDDMSHGEFGRGLYFSKYPSKAAQFSALGKLIEVQVAIGNTETVMRYDRTRKSPSESFDSIITPGRLYRPGDQGDVAMLAQEYVLFEPKQALPVCILSYTAYAGC